jgi:hypothetical protein
LISAATTRGRRGCTGAAEALRARLATAGIPASDTQIPEGAHVHGLFEIVKIYADQP